MTDTTAETFKIVMSLGYDEDVAQAVMENNDLASDNMDVVQFVEDKQYVLVEVGGGDDA